MITRSVKIIRFKATFFDSGLKEEITSPNFSKFIEIVNDFVNKSGKNIGSLSIVVLDGVDTKTFEFRKFDFKEFSKIQEKAHIIKCDGCNNEEIIFGDPDIHRHLFFCSVCKSERRIKIQELEVV